MSCDRGNHKKAKEKSQKNYDPLTHSLPKNITQTISLHEHTRTSYANRGPQRVVIKNMNFTSLILRDTYGRSNPWSTSTSDVGFKYDYFILPVFEGKC